MKFESPEYTIWTVIAVLAIIQLLYTFILYHASYRRLLAERKQNRKLSDNHLPGMSVIISSSDCEHLLEKHLPLILQQDYPDFEVIVVDDNSKDETKELLSRLSAHYPNLYSTFTSDSIRYISHKKLALMLGIKAAKKEWVVFIEPDCYPVSDQWLTQLARHCTDSTDVILGYSNYERKPGFANLCYMYDTLLQQLRMLGITIRGKGYMGIGRNMAYRRQIFFDNKGYSRHLDFERGEDDLFINEHVPSHRITASICSDSVVRCTSANPYAWKADKLSRLFIRGKMCGIQPYLLGADTFTRILLYVAVVGAITLSIMHHWWLSLGITAALWFISLGCRIYVFHRASRAFGERLYNVSLPLFDIIQPCWELFFRTYLLFSSKRAHLRRKV
jgi:glycosyltransferase involved in cell wall biosynthesis